jgi:hypothetical protein
MKNKMTAKNKILEINDRLIDITESLEPYAIYLCYLYPAILRNSYIELASTVDKDKEFLAELKVAFKPKHFIWKYIQETY